MHLLSICKINLKKKDNCEHLVRYFKELVNCIPFQSKMIFHTSRIYLPVPSPPDKKEVEKSYRVSKTPKRLAKTQSMRGFLNTRHKSIFNIRETFPKKSGTQKKFQTSEETRLSIRYHTKRDIMDINNYKGLTLLSIAYLINESQIMRRTFRAF